MNKLTIEFDEKGLKYTLEDPAPLETLYQVLLNACIAATNSVVNHGLEVDKKFDEPSFRASVHDKLNQAFSSILGHIDPAYENHPNLTEVAILLAENEILKQADAHNLSIEEYLPIAKAEQEKQLKLWKMNQEAEKKHKQKLNREAKPNKALKVLKGGK